MTLQNNCFTALLVSFALLKTTDGIPHFIQNIDSALAHPLLDFPQLTSFEDNYDFIIVGCGASGSLLANRLTQIPSFKVLCLEAGDKETPAAEVPADAAKLADTKLDWQYQTSYQEGICGGFKGKVCHWPRGKALGGSTVINYMVYTRANPKDFDSWNNTGNYGWSYEEVSPLYKKFENYGATNLHDPTVHGYKGELTIEQLNYETATIPYIIESAEDAGLPYTDMNGKHQIGISRMQAMLKNGRRLSAAIAFLYPIHDRPNLYVAKNAFVTKILINPKTKTAIGVEVSIFNVTYTVKAKKEVIISAGSINSPQLLMLSGIGPKSHLEDLNIKVIKDLPVGRYLKDHVRFGTVLFIVDKLLPIHDPHPITDYLFFGKGPNTVPARKEALGFFNTKARFPKSSQFQDDIPDIELLVFGLEEGGVEKIDGLSALNEDSYQALIASVKGKTGFIIAPVLLKPKSIGYLELKSNDPYEYPKIYPNYYKEEEDLEILLRGLRKAIEIGTGKALSKFKPKLHEFKLKPCARYQFNSDNFWKCAFQLLPGTLYHPVGTCKMGPKSDPGAVVDPELRVKGIKRLRVVDASIMPIIPSAHTTATCYIIAEKAADLIKDTYGQL